MMFSLTQLPHHGIAINRKRIRGLLKCFWGKPQMH